MNDSVVGGAKRQPGTERYLQVRLEKGRGGKDYRGSRFSTRPDCGNSGSTHTSHIFLPWSILRTERSLSPNPVAVVALDPAVPPPYNLDRRELEIWELFVARDGMLSSYILCIVFVF